jgi:hypothetical protein
MLHQNLSASIKWKPTVALPEMNVQMQLPNTLPYMTEVMTWTFSLQLQTVMHTHTFTGLRLKTPMRIPSEEGRLHLGFVHSDLKAKLKTEMCKSHRLGSAKTDTGYHIYWKYLWPLVNIQTTNSFWNNNNLKFYEKRYVMRYRTGTIFFKTRLPVQLLSQCKLPHLPLHW